jgi:acyl carrier protein
MESLKTTLTKNIATFTNNLGTFTNFIKILLVLNCSFVVLKTKQVFLKTLIKILLIHISAAIISNQNYYAQNLLNTFDYKLPDSGGIKSNIKFTNDFSGNAFIGNWYDYRNISLVNYDLKLLDLPVNFSFGTELGRAYDKNYTNFIYNMKFDLQSFLGNKIKKPSINRDDLYFDDINADSLINAEIKSKLSQELDNKLPKGKLDSLYTRVEEMKQFERNMNNPEFIESIKQQRTKLKEYNLGNAIDGLNYDSLAKAQNKFDLDYDKYKLDQVDKEIGQLRSKLDNLLANTKKIDEIKSSTETKVSNIKNKANTSSFLDFKHIDISKFNLGQSSVDNFGLVFKSHIVNGVNAEMKAPFYVNFVYSFPFQPTISPNYTIATIQNNQVSTLGAAIGSNPEKDKYFQIGYYSMNEKNGVTNPFKPENNVNINNAILTMTGSAKWSTKISSKIEIAKSESSQFNQNLWSFKDITSSTAIILKNELDLFNSNTKLKIDLQRIGLGYYSSGNRFVQRGTGGQIALTQKIGSKFNFKSKLSYRFSADSNRDNSNLSTYASLRYKINKSTSFETRANFFQNQIEYRNLYSYMNSMIYSLTWNQRVKIKKSYHQLMTTAQYSRNEFKSSGELNNSGLSRQVQVMTNYSTAIGKMTLNANLEDNYNIDSSYHSLGNGINLGYTISPKTNIGLGFTSVYKQKAFMQSGATMSLNTSFTQFSLGFNLMYVYDRLLNNNIISPQLRICYIVL